MGKRLLSVLLCLIVMLPTMTFANEGNVVDNEAPRILNVEVTGSSIDTTPPVAFVSNYYFKSRQGKAVGRVGEDIDIFVNASDVSGIKEVIADVSSPAGNISLNFKKITTSWSTTIDAGTGQEGIWAINKITVVDNFSNKTELTFDSFKFLILPSEYSLYNQDPIPINNTNNTVKISFSKEMDINSITNGSVHLIEISKGIPHVYNEENDLQISISQDKKIIFINRNEPFRDINYWVVIDNSVKDLSGNRLANPMFIELKFQNN